MGEKLEAIIDCMKSNEIVRNIGISYLFGLTTGVIGKEFGGDYQLIIPATPPAMDLLGAGRISPHIIPYGLGVASNYAERIYESTRNLL